MRPSFLLALAVSGAGCSASGPDAPGTDFVVAVEDETFVLRVEDPESVALGFAALRGEASVFPIGPLREGDGGFNSPWSWHVEPAGARFTEVAIEVCDGRPSYVEEHVAEFVPIGYCPWSGRVVGVRP
jgi:hypothetical protein